MCLDVNKLVSVSEDYSIKVWSISNEDISLIKEIKEHTSYVLKVIPLSTKRFASCSLDRTIKIWKDDETYGCLSTLRHDYCVKSILQLRGKERSISFVIWYE